MLRTKSGDKISDAVRVATLKNHAPEHTKGTLCQSPSDQRRSVDALTLWLRDASYVLPRLLEGQISMQVSALGDGGKRQDGQGQGQGQRLRQKQEQEKRSRQRQGSRPRTQASKKHSSNAVALTVQSPKCAVCTKRLTQQEAGTVAGVQEPEEESEGVKSVHWSDAENDEMEIDASSWCSAAVTKTERASRHVVACRQRSG